MTQTIRTHRDLSDGNEVAILLRRFHDIQTYKYRETKNNEMDNEITYIDDSGNEFYIYEMDNGCEGPIWIRTSLNVGAHHSTVEYRIESERMLDHAIHLTLANKRTNKKYLELNPMAEYQYRDMPDSPETLYLNRWTGVDQVYETAEIIFKPNTSVVYA